MIWLVEAGPDGAPADGQHAHAFNSDRSARALCDRTMPLVRAAWLPHQHGGIVTLCDACRAYSLSGGGWHPSPRDASASTQGVRSLAKPTKSARDILRERDERLDRGGSVAKRAHVRSQVAEEVRLLEEDARGLRKPID